jgi:hypothetical protein
MTEVDAFLTNCRLADGRLVDIGIAGGKIAAVGEGAAASSNIAPELDITGDLYCRDWSMATCISTRR